MRAGLFLFALACKYLNLLPLVGRVRIGIFRMGSKVPYHCGLAVYVMTFAFSRVAGVLVSGWVGCYDPCMIPAIASVWFDGVYICACVALAGFWSRLNVQRRRSLPLVVSKSMRSSVLCV
jgi:hypothetical protein